MPVEIYHIKAMGARNWNKFEQMVQKIEAARQDGLDVGGDTFPYLNSHTTFTALLPPWVSADGKMLRRLEDPEVCKRLIHELESPGEGWENLAHLAGPDKTRLLTAAGKVPESWSGKSVQEIAAKLGTSWPAAVIEVIRRSRGEAGVVLETMCEANLLRSLQLPWVIFGTDAGGREPSEKSSFGHPRGAGTYPRILGQYCRDAGSLPLEQAIHRMSGAVALKLSIADRGFIREGMYADLVLFDPAKVADRASYEYHRRPPEGIRHVLVNGMAVLADGKPTGARPGKIVRPVPRK